MGSWTKKVSASLAVPLTVGVLLSGCAPGSGEASETTAQQADGSVTIHLTRHGQTWFNELDRVQGWADSPLTSEGQGVATRLGEGIESSGMQIDAAYSGDMLRHRQTAELILAGAGSDLPVDSKSELREMSFGGYEGDFNSELIDAVLDHAGVDSVEELVEKGSGKFAKLEMSEHFGAVNPNPDMPTETSEQVADRALGALEEIATEEGGEGHDDVLVVSSGLTIMCVLDALGYDVTDDIANASMTTLVYAGGQWSIEGVNDTSLTDE